MYDANSVAASGSPVQQVYTTACKPEPAYWHQAPEYNVNPVSKSELKKTTNSFKNLGFVNTSCSIFYKNSIPLPSFFLFVLVFIIRHCHSSVTLKKKHTYCIRNLLFNNKNYYYYPQKDTKRLNIILADKSALYALYIHNSICFSKICIFFWLKEKLLGKNAKRLNTIFAGNIQYRRH